MKLFKTVTDLTKNTLPKLQITHSKPDKDAQDLENCRHTESCCMQEPQSALALCDKQAEIESQQLFSDGDQLKGLDAQSRGPVKLEYISKVNCQDSDSDMSPELESKGGNALKGIEMNQKTALKDAKGGEKRSNSQKGKENQANGFLDVKRPIGEKRSSFSAAGVKLFKDAFTRKWREQRKSVTEAPRFSAGKTSADVAMEMDEQDQEQIQQMSRKNLYARSVIDLKDSNCPEIAQEDNPLSNGKLKLAMEQKMRPAKSVEKGVNHAQGMKVKIDNLNTFGSFSKLPVVLEYEGTKGETRTTLDRSPKTSSAHTVLSLTSFTHKATAKKQSTPVVLPSLKNLIEGFVEYGIVLPVCAAMLYCVLPFGLLFVAHDYGNREIRIGLNFGFLGLLQGLVKIFLVRYMVDRPIRRKIKELEGSDSELIESKKYKLLSPFKTFFMMVYAIGAQVSSGVAIERLGYSVNSVSVLISLILITMLGGVLWAVIVLVQTPPKIENKKKILTKELGQINKLRKDFLKELHATRRELDQNAKDLQNGNEKLEKKQATENTYLACVGATTGIHSNLKADIKKFRCEDLAKYSEEIIKIRFNVFKVYGMLIVLLLELLALVKVLRGVNATEDVAALGFLIIIPVIGAVFAIIESCRSSTSRRHLVSVMKIINMIVIGGAYRFFYLVAPNHGVMIGAVVLKFTYKILMHYVPLFCHEKIVTFIRGNSIVRLFSRKKDSVVHFYRSNEDKEASSVRPIRYLLQKFIFLKITDSYFGLGSLMLLGASINWFPQLNIKLGLRIDDFDFYIGLVVIEFLIDILLLIHFSLLAKRAVKQKSKTMAISVRGELKNVIAERKMLIITVKAMILFLLVFTFVNQL